MANDQSPPAQNNLLPNGGFEQGAGAWKQHVAAGKFEFSIDSQPLRTGRASARLRCVEPSPKPNAKGQQSVWGRWYQTDVAVAPSKTYRLRVWVRTDSDFRGLIGLWVVGDVSGRTLARETLNTEGLWQAMVIEGIKPEANTLAIYLNLMDAPGTAWFDDIELVTETK